MPETNQNQALANSSITPHLQFLIDLEQFGDFVKQDNFKIKAYSDISVAKYLSFPRETQIRIESEFSLYYQFFKDAVASGISLREDIRLIRRFMQQLNFIYSEKMFDSLRPGDVIEVYNVDFLQIFRNLAFMDVCSYTVLDLLTHAPYELYERSLKINEYIAMAVTSLRNRDVQYSLDPLNLDFIPEHILREKFSEKKTVATVRLREAYPLYTWPRKLDGWLVIQRGETIAEAPKGVVFV